MEGVEQLVAGGEEGRDVFPVQAQPLAALSVERLASLAAFGVPGQQSTTHQICTNRDLNSQPW